MTATRVIGQYLLRDTMNAERYLQMLEDYVWPIVSGWENIDELARWRTATLCTDCTCLVRLEVSGTLARTRTTRMVCKNLMPCYFFLWGKAKEGV